MKRKFIHTGNKMKRRRQASAGKRGPKALAGSISSFCRVLAVSAIAAMGLGEAGAATFYWDAIGGGFLGGAGQWDGVLPWWNGATDVNWTNSGSNDAVFSNIAGAVSISSAVQVGAMTFNVDGYSLNDGGGGSITLAGASAASRTITVNNTAGLLTPNTAHIVVQLLGSNGFIKAGSGILSLEGDSSVGGLTGGITIDAGTLEFNFIDGHTSAILPSGNNLTFTNSGQFTFKADSAGNFGAQSMALNRLTFQGGEGIVKAEAADALQRGVLTFSNLFARTAGATGNLVQNSLPQITNANLGSAGSFTVTVPLAIASQLADGDSVTGTNIQANTKIAVGGIDTGTGVITLTLATTGSPSTQSLTFGAEQKRIIFTQINGAAPTTGFIDRGIFFNGSSYAWYDTSNFARVRAINYGVDTNTATQAASTTGIAAGGLNKHLQVNGDISGQGTATLLTLNLNGNSFSGGVALNPGTTLTLTNAGILKGGGGSTTISGGTIKAGATGTSEMVIRVDGPTEGLAITSVLTSNGVTKSGLGSLQLNPQTAGALSFSGSTTTNTSNTITLASAAPSSLVTYVSSQPANSVPVYGPGIQTGTTISSISGSTITLSLPATATSAFPLSYSTAVDSATNTVTLSPAEAGTLTLGQVVTGSSIAPNTTVQGINTTTGAVTLSANPLSSSPAQTLTFGGTTVAVGGTQNYNVTTGSLDQRQSTTQITSSTVTLLSAAPGTLVQGMSVSGPGIAAGTTVAGVSGTTVTLSQPAQADSVPINSTITSQFTNGVTTYNVTNAQAANLVSGSAVSGTGIPVGTTFTLGAANSGGSGNTQVTLSNAFTAASGNYTPTYGGALIQFGTSTLTVSPAVAATLLVGMSVSGPALTSQVAPNTVITNIQLVGANYIVTLSNAMSGTAAPEFVTFGGGSLVSINSAYTGSTLVNSGVFAVGAAGLPAGGLVNVAGGARFAAVSSVITNNISLVGADAILSGSGISGSSSGFSGTITTGVNNFQLIAKDFITNADTNLNISGPIVGSGTLTVPSDSNGLVTLSGNNAGFTGPVIVGNGAKLSIARLNSLANGNPVDLSGTLILALDGNGGAAYASGGNGTGAPQTLTLTSSVTLSGTGVIQPDRDGTAYGGYFLNARNKTVQINNLTLTGVDLTVQNNNGYGLGITGTTDLGAGLNTITVANATSSNVVQGLTLNGTLVGGLTGPGAAIFRKLGPGTLVLANNANTFGGGGSVISIEQGVLATASNITGNGVFGDSANVINLNWGGTGVVSTLRTTSNLTIPIGRSILLSSAANNGIEVAGGTTLTLASPFVFPTGLQTNGITKGENGTLLISADNKSTAVVKTYSTTIANAGDTSVFLSPANAATLSIGWFVRGTNMAPGAKITAIDTFTGEVTFDLPTTGPGTQPITYSGAWAGPLTITAGAVQVLTGNALGDGTGAISVTRSGAALQIGGGITVANRLTIAGTGLNSAGALQSRPSSTNTVSGQIILGTAVPTAAIIGADATSVLNITGGVTGTLNSTLTFNSVGNINITTNPFDPAYTFTGDTGLGTTINNVSDTSNIVVGQGITGPGIPAGARITAKTANSLTLSAAATLVATSNLSSQGFLNVVKIGAGTTTLAVDSPTYVGTLTVNQGTFAINGNSVTIGTASTVGNLTVQAPSGVLVVDDSSGPATPLRLGGEIFPNVSVANNNRLILTDPQAASLFVNEAVFGSNIPVGTTISSILPAKTATGTTTNGSATISFGSGGTAGLAVGMAVSGPGIPVGEFITAINAGANQITITTGTGVTAGIDSSLNFSNLVTLSANATGPVGGALQTVNFGNNRNMVLTGGTLTYNGNAAGSTELFGSLTTNRSATNVVQSNPSGANPVALNFLSLTINGDSNIDFQGSGLGVNGTNKITFTSAPGMTNNIIQRATLNGSDFVSYNTTGAAANTNGIQAFANYNVANNIDSAATTDTLNITSDPIFTASKTINAFRISGGTTATGSALQGNAVTLSAGAILSTTGFNTVNFPVLTFGAQGFVAVSSGGQLTIGSVLNGGSGFVKALPGTLLLNAPDDRAGYANLSGQTLTGNFEVNAGTLKLGGGNNTLTPNQFLIVAPGATLDLNGTSQFATGTRGDGAALQGNAGTFTNSSTTNPAALIFGADSGGVNFGGVIKQETGAQAMSFFKGSAQTYNFYNANTYTGPTVFAGGINELRDGGTLANTTSITLNYARLAFNDDFTNSLTNRVNLTAPITMRGASLAYANGRTQSETTQAVGAVTLMEGQNMIQAVNSGGTSTTAGVNSAVLTLASLSRSVGSSATVRFPDNGTLGLIGNSGRIVITAAPTLSQNLIGPWAVVDREFASYIPTLGVGALSTAGFAGYSANFLNRQPLATDNIRTTLNIPGLAVDTTVNTLAVNTNVAAVGGVPVPTVIDLGTKKLTLAGGGLILALNGDNQNITVQNGTITSGALNVGGDLYLHALNYGGTNRTFTLNAVIANNGAGAVRLVKASGSVDGATDFLTIGGANTYTGGTVINGGNVILASTGVIPAGGLTISGGEVVGTGALIQDAGGVINSANTVTMNGLGALTLSGNNTLAGLVFNDTGIGSTGTQTAAPTVTTFRSVTALGTGTLTLGGGGIVSTPLNPAAISTVVGRLDFGAAPSTVTVNAYNFSTFTDFAPTTAGLILQGVIGSAGTITKAGTGVLQLNAQETFTGQLNVTAGTIQIGVGNGGSRFSQLNLNGAATRLNINGQSTVIGSLAGSGIVTNTVVNTPTLTVGFDGTSTTFSGQISRFTDALPNALTLVKVGAGTLTITSAQSALSGSSGGVTVNGGGLTYSGAGAAYPSTVLTPVTYNVNTGGTLTLDNNPITSSNVANRLGLNASNGTLGLGGGTLMMIANAAASSETINLLNFNGGASTIQFGGGAGGTVTLNVTGNVSGQGGQDTALVTGLGLGSTVNVVVTGAFPSTGGGGGAGTDTISIRPDLLGDATGGSGTGFLTRDSSNRLRPLNQTTELTPDMAQAAITGGNSNTGLTSASNLTNNRIIANQTINSFTLLGAGTPTLSSGVGMLAGVGTTPASGVFGPNAAPLTLTVTSGGILALANASIGVLNGGVAITSGGVTEDYHVVGAGVTLNLFGSILNTTNGIVKADAGTLIFNAPQYYTGAIGTNGTTVNGGTLKLNGGSNTVLVQPTGTIPNVYSLFVNGGTFDLNGNNQNVERLSNNNANAGTGGFIINSGGSAVTFSSATATGTTFAGSIGTGVLSGTNNAINFDKAGNSTLTLTSANTYTGTTVLRGGGLTLQDGGTLAQTSSVTVNFGTLLFNQAGLNPLGNPNPTRIPATTPLTLNGGTLQQNSGGSVDSSATFNTVNLGSGASTITQNTLANAGSSALFSIGSLVQQSLGATVSIASSSGTLGGGGLNNNQVQITSMTPSGSGASSPASLLRNGMLPAWITVNGTDFAGYLPSATAGSQGVGAIGSVNYPAYAAPFVPYSTAVMPAAQILANATSSDNLSVAVSMQAVAGRTVNSIAVRNPAANVVGLIPINLSTDTLSIGTGGLLLNSGTNGGASAVVQGGRITAGATANSPGVLYVTSSGTNAQIINSQIVNNGNQTYGVTLDSGIIGTGTSGALQLGSNVIMVGSTSGLSVGQSVSGVGIPVGSVITAIASTGTPFPVGSVITRTLNGTVTNTTPIAATAAFTIGTPTTSSSFRINAVTQTSVTTTSGSPTINVLVPGTIVAGMYVTGPGIPGGTVVTSVGTGANTGIVTLSNPVTASMAAQNFFAQVGNQNTSFTLPNAQAALLTVGMTVTGGNIRTVTNTPSAVYSTYVTNIAPEPGQPTLSRITLSQSTTTAALSTQLLSFGATLNFARMGNYEAIPSTTTNGNAPVTVNNNTGIVLGQPVSGPGIPAGTVVATIPSGTGITLGDTTITTGTGGNPNGVPVTATQSNSGINLTFGSSVTIGNGTSGAVSLVKTGTGTLTLSPQLVMNAAVTGGATPSLVVAVPTTAGLQAGMTVSGSGIPAGAFIASVNPGNSTITLDAGHMPTTTSPGTGTQITYGPGTSGITLSTSAWSNTYTGGTFVNQGVLVLAGYAGATVIPGDLAISNSGVMTSFAAAGTTAANSNSISMANVTGLSVGMAVAGPSIPGGEFITGISGNTITITTGTGVTAATNSQLTFGNPQQIAGSSNLTINGGGGLNLTGANTFANLTFNNSGGNVTPAVVLGNGGLAGTLTLTNGVTAVNDNLSFTPLIYSANSVLALPNNTITTSGASPDSLIIAVPLAPAGALVKNGTGSVVLGPSTVTLQQIATTTNAANTITVANGAALATGMTVSGTGIAGGSTITGINGNTVTLSANANSSATNLITFSLATATQSTFTGGVNLNAGSIILAQSSTPTSGTVTSGPLGTGTLNMATGTALLSDGTLRTIANAVNIAAGANVTFGPLPGSGAALAGNGVTLAGPVTLNGGSATITVPDLLNVTTISGVLSGGANLTLNKNGTGTLLLSNGANTFSGTTTVNVNAGVLKLGASTALPAGIDLTIAQGAAYDINANANQFLKTLSGAGMVTNSGGSQTLFIGGTNSSDVTTNVNATFDGTLTAATTGNLLLNKVGIGRQTLTGVSTYTGATTVTSGSLIVNGSLANTTLTVNGGAVLGGTGVIGNLLGGTVNVIGGTTPATRGTIDLTTNAAIGTLSLATLGTNNALTAGGAAAGNPSVFNFDFNNNSTDRIAIQGIARFNVQAGGAIVNLTQVGGTPLVPGVYPLISFASTNTTNSALFLAGTVNGGSAGAAQTYGGSFNNYSLSITPSYLRLVVAGVGVEPDLYWKGGFSANWNSAVPATSNWATAAAGTPLSTTLPSASTFVHFAATSPGNLSSTTLGQSFTIGQLQFETATTGAIGIDLGTNTLTLNGDMVKQASSGAVTFTGTALGALVVGGTQAWTNQSATDITISAPIVSSSTNTLLINPSAAGKIIFNGNNIGLTGGVTVSGNGSNTALQLGASATNALGPAAGPNPLVVNLGALDMNGQSATVSSLRSDTTTGFIKNTAGGLSTLTVNQSAATTYSGQLGFTSANNLALSLTGGGTLTLITTANTYTGGTTIANATLRMGNGGNENAASLGTGLVTVNAGGLLSFAPGNTTTTFNIPSSFVLDGGGLQSSGGNQHIATGGATIAVNAGGATITPSTTSGQDLFLDGQLTGSGPLNVGNTGSGKVILTNNTNTYSGTLTSTASGNLQLAGGVANSTALQFAAVVNNAGGLTFLTPVTSATFGSLAGSGNFALQNTANAALSLTVGGNNTDTSYTGIMSNSAAGINGSLTKVGTGTLTLAGLNTYRGATTVSRGALRVNNASATASVTGLGSVSVAGIGAGAGQTATLGGSGVIQGGDGVAAGSVALGNFSFLDPGLTPASFGTLRIGVQSGAATTQLTLGSGSSYKFDVGAGAGSQDRVLIVGNALLTGSILAINSLSTPDQGKYTILSATNGIGGTTFSSITGVPAGYSVVYTANTVDLQLSATGMVISTPAGLQVITGGTVPFNVFVQNTVASGGANIVFTAASGANTQGSVSPGVTVQPQNTGTGVGLSFNSTAVPIGPGQTGSFTVTDTAGANTPQPATVNVDVLGHADYGSFAGGTLTLPNVREGYSGPQTSTNSLTVTNTAGYRVNLKGDQLVPGPVGNLSLSSFSGLIPGASGSITASLAAGLTASATPYSQDFLYKFGDDSTLVGNNSYLNSQNDITITATVNVYNGQGVWGPVPGGSWGTFGNWKLPGGYPGLDGALSIADTATIGSDLTGVLALDGSSPAINVLTFNGSNGTIAQGTGGTLTLRRDPTPPTQAAINVTGGTPTISAPVVFANTVTVTTNGVNDQLTISGPVSGSGGLTKAGPGTLALSGNNTYNGKTAVNGGTLSATSEASLGTVPGATVADQISINNNAKLAFTGNTNLSSTQGITVGAGNGTLDVATGQTAIIGGSISGSGTLTKTGNGTMDVRNQNAFVGPFVLTAGTFAVHASNYDPQTTPTLTADVGTGSLTFSGGTLAINVFGTAGAGSVGGHDHLGTSGLDGNLNPLTGPSVSITAPTNLTINLGAFVPTPNVDKFTFISDSSGFSPITNSYFVVNGTTAAPGVTFQVGPYGFQINYADGVSQNEITLFSVTPVPEPGSLALLLGGAGLLGLTSRRRQRKSPFAV